MKSLVYIKFLKLRDIGVFPASIPLACTDNVSYIPVGCAHDSSSDAGDVQLSLFIVQSITIFHTLVVFITPPDRHSHFTSFLPDKWELYARTFRCLFFDDPRCF